LTVVIEQSGPGGRPIKIEIEGASDGDLDAIYGDEETRDLPNRIIATGRSLFEDALELVDTCAAAMAEHIDAMTGRAPDEVELQLAIKVDGKVGARIVELTGGAQLQVAMRWKTTHG